MKDIIEAMFYGEINESVRKTAEPSQEAKSAYDEFEKALNDEPLELFDKYYLEEGLYLGAIEKERYEQGVKRAFGLLYN